MAQKKWPSGTPGIYKLENKPNGKCRLWRLVVTLTKEVNGKKTPSQVAQNFEGTFKEAVEARHALKASVKKDTVIVDSSTTFNEYKEVFLQSRRDSGEIAPGTIRREKDKLNAISLHIGEMALKDITSKTINSAIDKLRKGQSLSGRRLSGTYLNDIVKKTSLLMDKAVEDKIIKANPCDEVKRPKTDTAPKRALVSNAVSKLINELNPAEQMELGVVLCVTLGLRRCETVGLSWEDINFDERTVYVLHDYDDEGNLTESKTVASERFLPMPQFVCDALLKRKGITKVLLESYAPDLLHKPAGSEETEICGAVPVLCDRHGNRYHPASLGQWWYRHRALYGLDDWKLHELRHTFLTLAAKKKVHPSVMQKLAGHSTARITMDIYTHVNMDDKEAAMESISEVFEPLDKTTPDKDDFDGASGETVAA